MVVFPFIITVNGETVVKGILLGNAIPLRVVNTLFVPSRGVTT